MAAPLVCEPGSISFQQAEDMIYAPGSPCELADFVVHGERMRLFKNALPNVREHYLQMVNNFADRPCLTMYTPEGKPEVGRLGVLGCLALSDGRPAVPFDSLESLSAPSPPHQSFKFLLIFLRLFVSF